MSYRTDLAFHLRLRQLPEREVTKILLEVRELALASGVTPEAEFGRPEDYAGSFDRGRRRVDLALCTFVTCVVVILALASWNMAADLRGTARLTTPGQSLVVFALLFVSGATTAILLLHRLPRAVRRQLLHGRALRPRGVEQSRAAEESRSSARRLSPGRWSGPAPRRTGSR